MGEILAIDFIMECVAAAMLHLHFFDTYSLMMAAVRCQNM